MRIIGKLKAIIIIIIGISMVVSTVGCQGKGGNISVGDLDDEDIKVWVYTTFYPIYDFAKKIGGDKLIVENIVPPGVEPHDFEPSPKQIAIFSDADVFIYLGEPMDPWAEKISGDLEARGLKVLKAGEGLMENDDPHIWLDPIIAKELSKRIFQTIVGADEDNREFYEGNLASLNEEFDELDREFKDGLADITRKDVVMAHAAVGYLAKRYGLNQIPITGLSPQEEPSPRKMAELVELVRERDIKYIFFEELASPKFSETIASEVGADLLVFNPVGGLTLEQIRSGEDYFSMMRRNLENLKTALE
ncbi:MAG: zinc ABC transporter substrate-binding protein [Tissierellaceae bacterium]|nr:zinc ABC transporter substrate-binding protein [Tissierellaceae bacterium]